MLANRRENKISGNITQEDIPLNENRELISFVENILSDLTQDDEREDALTQKLIQLAMFNQDPVRWTLVRENVNKDKSCEDIGISHKSNQHKIIFVFEAKRLDSRLPKYRTKEYILGKIGGIERFKRDKHGKNLTHAGMIGYVQTDDFDIWKDKINDWIDEEIETSSSTDIVWTIDDTLKEKNQTIKIARYSSSHNCNSGKDIDLTHLWVRLNLL